MLALWNPTETLNLPTHHNCVVPRTARKGHCGITLPQAQVTRFDALVQDLAQRAPDADDVGALLVALAECGLCKQFHSRQREVVVEGWVGRIEGMLERRQVSSHLELVSVKGLGLAVRRGSRAWEVIVSWMMGSWSLQLSANSFWCLLPTLLAVVFALFVDTADSNDTLRQGLKGWRESSDLLSEMTS